MRMRLLALVSGLAVVVATATAAAAQATDRRVPEKTGRTSWGDPDLQGNYTNLYEDGTPLERPDEFQDRTINNFEGPIHAPNNWWQDALDLKRGSQAWLIVDPPDGKIPPMTPEGQRRSALRVEARRAS